MFTVEFMLFVLVVMWLFNLLSFVPQTVKDVTNCVVIILLILFKFVL